MGMVNIPIAPELIAAMFFKGDEIGGVSASVDPDNGNVVLRVEHGDLPDMEQATIEVGVRRGVLGQRVIVINAVSETLTGRRWELDTLMQWREQPKQGEAQENDQG